MERALTLRSIQLRTILKYGVLCALGIGMIGYLMLWVLPTDGVTYATSNLIETVLYFSLSFACFAVPIFEGRDNFDEALRFGIARKHILAINLAINTVLAVLASYFKENNLSFQIALVEHGQQIQDTRFIYLLINNLIAIFGLAVISYAVYRYGWKVIGLLFGAFAFTGLGAMMYFFRYLVATNGQGAQSLLTWYGQYQFPIRCVVLAFVVFLYYRSIQKTEIAH